MVHHFKVNNEYLLYDVESSSLLFVDKIVYDILSSSNTLDLDYSQNDITEAKAELETLRKEKIIDCAAPADVTGVKSREIKALCLHVSHDCNLRCKYCFAGTGAYCGKRENMPFDVAKQAVDFLIENSGGKKNLEMDFFGGEPLLNFSVLKQTVDYAKRRALECGKTFKFTTTTNGVLLDEETCGYLNEHMENVVLSLDGRKETNDFHRPTVNGKGSFDVIVDKMLFFKKIRGNKSYYVRGTFTNKNANFYDDVLALADLGFDQVSVEPVVLPESHQLALTEEDAEAVCGSYEKLAIEYLQRRQTPEKWFSFFHFVIDLLDGPCYKKRLTGCGAGCEYLAVTPDGKIYPCHQFAGEHQYVLGDVFSKMLDKNLQQVFYDADITQKKECCGCFAKYHCSGGCNANAIHFSGDINIPYALACKFMKKRLECALYVYAKEHKNN